jgi:hypothetical protein
VCLDSSACSRLTDDAFTELERRGTLLDARRGSGFVRQCHGDLHLRNIVLLDGRPTLFDGVEFIDEISYTDVLADLAFLADGPLATPPAPLRQRGLEPVRGGHRRPGGRLPAAAASLVSCGGPPMSEKSVARGIFTAPAGLFGRHVAWQWH